MKLLRVLIALLLFTSVSYGQTKEELQKQKVLLQDQIDLASTLLKQTQSSRATSLNQLQTLNQKIEARERLITTMNRQIRNIDREVKAKEQEMQEWAMIIGGVFFVLFLFYVGVSEMIDFCQSTRRCGR